MSLAVLAVKAGQCRPTKHRWRFAPRRWLALDVGPEVREKDGATSPPYFYVFTTAKVFHDRPAQADPPGPLSPGHPVVGPDSVARCVARSKHGGHAVADARADVRPVDLCLDWVVLCISAETHSQRELHTPAYGHFPNAEQQVLGICRAHKDQQGEAEMAPNFKTRSAHAGQDNGRPELTVDVQMYLRGRCRMSQLGSQR